MRCYICDDTTTSYDKKTGDPICTSCKVVSYKIYLDYYDGVVDQQDIPELDYEDLHLLSSDIESCWEDRVPLLHEERDGSKWR